MNLPVIEKIKRLPRQTEESLRDAFSVLMSVEDRREADHYIKWIRSEAKQIRTAAFPAMNSASACSWSKNAPSSPALRLASAARALPASPTPIASSISHKPWKRSEGL